MLYSVDIRDVAVTEVSEFALDCSLEEALKRDAGLLWLEQLDRSEETFENKLLTKRDKDRIVYVEYNEDIYQDLNLVKDIMTVETKQMNRKNPVVVRRRRCLIDFHASVGKNIFLTDEDCGKMEYENPRYFDLNPKNFSINLEGDLVDLNSLRYDGDGIIVDKKVKIWRLLSKAEYCIEM